MMWGWDSGWWGLGMMFVWLVFLGVIVVGVVFLARSFGSSARQSDGSARNAALDILDQRFARGEIDQSEYEERRRTLSGGQ